MFYCGVMSFHSCFLIKRDAASPAMVIVTVHTHMDFIFLPLLPSIFKIQLEAEKPKRIRINTRKKWFRTPLGKQEETRETLTTNRNSDQGTIMNQEKPSWIHPSELLPPRWIRWTKPLHQTFKTPQKLNLSNQLNNHTLKHSSKLQDRETKADHHYIVLNKALRNELPPKGLTPNIRTQHTQTTTWPYNQVEPSPIYNSYQIDWNIERVLGKPEIRTRYRIWKTEDWIGRKNHLIIRQMAGIHRDIRQYFKHSISGTEKKGIPEGATSQNSETSQQSQSN